MNNGDDEADATVEPTENDTTGELPATSRQVGFRRPPEATRFQKGVSGNPRGRPRGSLNVATAFAKALREKVVINEHGKRKTVTKLEAAMKQVVNKGASGDLRAVVQVVALAQYAEAKQSVQNLQDPVIADVDKEVIEGIVKRFQETRQQESSEVHGGNDDRNERG
jgi:hypothetical protein